MDVVGVGGLVVFLVGVGVGHWILPKLIQTLKK